MDLFGKKPSARGLYVGLVQCTMYNGTTDEERDLGVIISSNLKPSAHVFEGLANKAMSVLGMMKRNFPRLDTASFNIIYKDTFDHI